jgi:hypothetical protein
MEIFAATVAWKSKFRDMVIDVAELEDGRIEMIEFNPAWPGGFGLYACDSYGIAFRSRVLLPEDMLAEVDRRKAMNDPAPVPTDAPSPSRRRLLDLIKVDEDEPFADGP